MTRREAIVQAVVAKMALIPGITTYRERIGAMPRADAPIARVRVVEDGGQPRLNTQQEHLLTIAIAIYTVGETPEASADPFSELAHLRMLEDPNLGGAHSVAFERALFNAQESDGGASAVVESFYAIRYRTRFDTLV